MKQRLKELKRSLKQLTGRFKRKNSLSAHSCPVCKSNHVEFNPLSFYYFREFDKNQFVHSIFLFETLNLEFYSCSCCGSSDRDRLYALYFDKILKNTKKENVLKVLDIAPAPALTNFLKSHAALSVTTADLYMEMVDDNIDITDMGIYTDESFDVFICSHVLEHIENDAQAMKELYRVLKPGGWGIAMVPVNLGLKDNLEDPAIRSDPERWKYYGQGDHVRMYSKTGFADRLQNAGFSVNQLGITYFGEDIFNKNGLNPRSVLYVVTK
jgi:SAM-dependent methyltransferase